MKYLCEFILNDIKNQGQSMQTGTVRCYF